MFVDDFGRRAIDERWIGELLIDLYDLRGPFLAFLMKTGPFLLEVNDIGQRHGNGNITKDDLCRPFWNVANIINRRFLDQTCHTDNIGQIFADTRFDIPARVPDQQPDLRSPRHIQFNANRPDFFDQLTHPVDTG